MKNIKILIVEDQPSLAETHRDFLWANVRCDSVWIANDLTRARYLIETIKPALILLDNYLPDGEGIELVRELMNARNPIDVVFTTAASDMETVSEAIRLGVFDYLVKPINYERLKKTFQRYVQRKTVLEMNQKTNQNQIDDMFNTYAREEKIQNREEKKGELPLGIDESTLEKVLSLFQSQDDFYTAEAVAQALQLSRTTARRYLEYSTTQGEIGTDTRYGKVGRPQRVYCKR